MEPTAVPTFDSPGELIGHLGALLQSDDASLEADQVRQLWSDRLQAAMQAHPLARSELGKLRGELIRHGRNREKHVAIDWVDLGSGRLAIGHRPGRKMIAGLPLAGATHVVTLLGETEGAERIGRDVQRAGLAWIWVPMETGEPPAPERSASMRAKLGEVAEALDGGGSLYLHCSAGIHRTGMVTHALLRMRGLEAEEARAKLGELRSVTAAGVGDHRLAWGQQFGQDS